MKDAIESFEKNLDKSGFFANIANHNAKGQLKKMLGIHEFEVNSDTIEQLKTEYDYAKLEAEEKETELEIQKSGNIHQMMEQIRLMKKKQSGIATKILKNQRRQALKGLLKDQVKRQRLKIHARSLVERKQRLQNNILDTEDFKPLLEAFPCLSLIHI